MSAYALIVIQTSNVCICIDCHTNQYMSAYALIVIQTSTWLHMPWLCTTHLSYPEEKFEVWYETNVYVYVVSLLFYVISLPILCDQSLILCHQSLILCHQSPYSLSWSPHSMSSVSLFYVISLPILCHKILDKISCVCNHTKFIVFPESILPHVITSK